MNHSIGFEQHEFLTFFDTEDVLEKEAGIVRYSVRDENKMLFSLYISTYDQYAIVSLKYGDVEKYVFEVGMRNISRISCDKQNLYFYKNKEDHLCSQQDANLIEPFLIVNVKPTVAISIDL